MGKAGTDKGCYTNWSCRKSILKAITTATNAQIISLLEDSTASWSSHLNMKIAKLV